MGVASDSKLSRTKANSAKGHSLQNSSPQFLRLRYATKFESLKRTDKRRFCQKSQFYALFKQRANHKAESGNTSGGLQNRAVQKGTAHHIRMGNPRKANRRRHSKETNDQMRKYGKNKATYSGVCQQAPSISSINRILRTRAVERAADELSTILSAQSANLWRHRQQTTMEEEALTAATNLSDQLQCTSLAMCRSLPPAIPRLPALPSPFFPPPRPLLSPPMLPPFTFLFHSILWANSAINDSLRPRGPSETLNEHRRTTQKMGNERDCEANGTPMARKIGTQKRRNETAKAQTDQRELRGKDEKGQLMPKRQRMVLFRPYALPD